MNKTRPKIEVLCGYKLMISLSSQGSEIFTIVAKDGDVGDPNPIRYSFDGGRHTSMKGFQRYY